eukprot:scaffold48388_cov37-Cyclotella_meneghiniana.AAC.1
MALLLPRVSEANNKNGHHPPITSATQQHNKTTPRHPTSNASKAGKRYFGRTLATHTATASGLFDASLSYTVDARETIVFFDHFS